MRSHLQFRSEALSRDGTSIRGAQAASMLAERLPAHGFAVERVDAEDWGWRIQIANDAFDLWIGCGHLEDYADGHLCFIEPSRPYVRRWLKRVSTLGPVERLAAALEHIVRARDDTYDVRWWSEAEVLR